MWVVDFRQLLQNGRRKLSAFGRGLSPQIIITSLSLSRDQYPLSHFDLSPFSTSAWVFCLQQPLCLCSSQEDKEQMGVHPLITDLCLGVTPFPTGKADNGQEVRANI